MSCSRSESTEPACGGRGGGGGCRFHVPPLTFRSPVLKSILLCCVNVCVCVCARAPEKRERTNTCTE